MRVLALAVAMLFIAQPAHAGCGLFGLDRCAHHHRHHHYRRIIIVHKRVIVHKKVVIIHEHPQLPAADDAPPIAPIK